MSMKPGLHCLNEGLCRRNLFTSHIRAADQMTLVNAKIRLANLAQSKG